MFGWISTYIARANIRTIADVLRVMNSIEEMVPEDHGIAVFNRLYRTVTEAVKEYTEAGNHLSGAWLPTLTVQFAMLYFEAIARWSEGSRHTPKSWRVLFDHGTHHDVQPVQFALAGLSAHIIVDLPLALVRTARTPCHLWWPMDRRSKEYADFNAVNTILDEVETRVLRTMLPEKTERILTFTPLGAEIFMAVVRSARQRAWQDAERMGSDPEAVMDIINARDSETATLNRALLLPATLPSLQRRTTASAFFIW